MESVLTDKAAVDRAIVRARAEAIQQHRQANQPMVVWRDGQVVWLQPSELPDPDQLTSGQM